MLLVIFIIFAILLAYENKCRKKEDWFDETQFYGKVPVKINIPKKDYRCK